MTSQPDDCTRPDRSGGRIIEVTAEHELVWEYISPYWGTLFKMNMVYGAYRFPYEWIPQVDPHKEIPIEPVDVTSFRIPGASPKGPCSEVTVEDTIPLQATGEWTGESGVKSLIDAHVHLDSYSDEIDSVLEEISKYRILTISNSMDIPSYERNVEIGSACDFVIPTFGIHPWNAHKYADQLKNLDQYIKQSPMIGEIGLDYYFDEDPAHFPAQRKVFKHFLQTARDQDKIVNLHTKGAEREILNLLTQYEIRRAIVHWYSGPMDVLCEFVGFGAYFTVGVELAFSDHIKAIAKAVPLDRLLTETDNPGGIKWLTGNPGMPLEISDVVRELAKVKNTTPETIIKTVDSTFVQLVESDSWIPDRLFQ